MQSTIFRRKPHTMTLTASFLLAFALAFPLTGLGQEADWEPLFDGVTLAGWTSTGDANWRVDAGAIVVDAGSPCFLMSDDRFDNYELSLEFRNPSGTNSGIFLRTTTDVGDVATDCYELNIAPPDNPFPTGSLVNRIRFDGDEQPNTWRTYQIRVEGARVRVFLDGNKIVDYATDTPPTGRRIGLQYRIGPVAFRNIRTRQIK